jgi:hypothetical protein
LTEDLREAKQYEHKYKAVYTMKLSLENERDKLFERLSEKLEREAESDIPSREREQEKRAGEDMINTLQDKLNKKVRDEQAGKAQHKQKERELEEAGKTE